jgi:hypothetical protein
MASDGRGGRTGLIVVVVLLVLGVIAYALGLFNVDASGDLKAPDVAVDVKGGELPKVQVETGDIDVGTTTETVKVPDVDVKTKDVGIKVPDIDIQKAGDDGSANK